MKTFVRFGAFGAAVLIVAGCNTPVAPPAPVALKPVVAPVAAQVAVEEEVEKPKNPWAHTPSNTNVDSVFDDSDNDGGWG